MAEVVGKNLQIIIKDIIYVAKLFIKNRRGKESLPSLPQSEF